MNNLAAKRLVGFGVQEKCYWEGESRSLLGLYHFSSPQTPLPLNKKK